MRADYSLRCDDDYYRRWQGFVVTCMIVYSFGIPLLFLAILFRKKHVLFPAYSWIRPAVRRGHDATTMSLVFHPAMRDPNSECSVEYINIQRDTVGLFGNEAASPLNQFLLAASRKKSETGEDPELIDVDRTAMMPPPLSGSTASASFLRQDSDPEGGTAPQLASTTWLGAAHGDPHCCKNTALLDRHNWFEVKVTIQDVDCAELGFLWLGAYCRKWIIPWGRHSAQNGGPQVGGGVSFLRLILIIIIVRAEILVLRVL
mmetsp:Transcript_9467/g.21941  ORF Transcript_9467/g.21941 Transcript_9467/m.21941 type:complete len:259 (+) Transcript_9467:173-949(+)